jgi:hypothetical protein
MWEALSASDELQLVGDVDLLREVARAYRWIGATAYLERQHWEAMHDPAQWRTFIDVQRQKDVTGQFRSALQRALANGDGPTKAAIDVALEVLSRELGEDPPPNLPLRVDQEADTEGQPA